MKNLLHAIGRLKIWQQALLGAMLLVVLLTWLAVCLVLTGALGP
jgi:hypothetical protein